MSSVQVFQPSSNELLKVSDILSDPNRFNNEHITTTAQGWVLDASAYKNYSIDQSGIQSFKRTKIEKDKCSGSVSSESNSLSIIESANASFVTLRKLFIHRSREGKVCKSVDSLKIRVDKSKAENLPFLVSTILERNLLKG